MARVRILFVDDEALALDGLRRALSEHAGRWELHFADDPRAALDLWRQTPFDLVVTDEQMPGMTGTSMIEEMRQSAAPARFLLLTGTADLSVAIKAINQARIFRFLVKPCPTDILVGAIESALAELADVAAGKDALEHLPSAVLVVNDAGKVLFTNHNAATLMRDGKGLILGRDGICRAGNPLQTQHLHAAIRIAVEAGEGTVLAVERDEGRALSMAICATGGTATLYINDPDQTCLASPDELETLLGVTPAEARLSHALASGATVEDAAIACGITVGTARAYLKQIFQKTDIQRQADLVRLVLCQPTVRTPPI